jgi:serine protease
MRLRHLRAPLLGLFFGLVVLAPPAGAEPSTPQPTGRVVVFLDPGAKLRSVIRAASARNADGIPELDAMVASPPAGLGVAALRDRLLTIPGVRSVEVEHRLYLRALPNDPGLSTRDPNAPSNDFTQWNLRRENFPDAWEIASADSLLVGFVDSGVDAGHPDFAGRVTVRGDHDQNPFHSGDAGVDEFGHGTHVAGLACAATGNGYGIASAGQGCRIGMEKVNATDIGEADVASGIVDLTNAGAKVINLSLGGPGASSLISQAIDYAVDRDVVLVAAAADEPVQDQGIPASYLQPTGSGSDISAGRGLVVTSAQYGDTRSGFAGLGSQISVAAYGEGSGSSPGIFSTFPANSTELDSGISLPSIGTPCGCRATFNGDNRFAYLLGTSMAAPQVTGAAALIRSLNPDLSAADVIRVIKFTARRSGGWDANLGWGILNAGAALAAAQAIDRDPPASSARTSRRRTRKRAFTITVSGTDDLRPRLKASGIKSFGVYRSKDNGRFRFIRRLSQPGSFRVTGLRGHLYRFYSRAIDNSGNREAAPPVADARIRILRR